MTLQQHYQRHQHHLDAARQLADARDRIALAVRFRRIPPLPGNLFQFCATQDIIRHLTQVQAHATEIEHQEALFIARQERAFYDAVIYSIAIPNPPPAIGVPRSLTEEDKRQIAREAKAAKQRQYRHDKAARQPVSRDYCGRCQATGIDPLSADGVHLNCKACGGTGLAETETEEAAA